MTLNRRSLLYAQKTYMSICDVVNKRSLSFFTVEFDWEDDSNKRLVTKEFYDKVFHATNTHTKLITQKSVDARIAYDLNPKFDKNGNKKPYQPCYDHVTTPQLVGRYLYEEKKHIFNYSEEGWTEFMWWFEYATNVVETTKEENTELSKLNLTKPSDEKYEIVGIILCERFEESKWINSIPTDRKFNFPQEFLDYEKKCLEN